MTNEPTDPETTAIVEDMRNELKDELLRAAQAHEGRRRIRRRRLGFATAAVLVAGVPVTLAVAELAPDDEELIPAPAPLFAPGGPYADCPREIQQLVVEVSLDGDNLAEYAESPGYPVPGCPTVEAIEDSLPTAEELERMEAIWEEHPDLAPQR